MAEVIFYEKSGCSGNQRQKATLEAAGHTVHSCDLRSVPWSKEKLFAFFDGLPISEWFNPSAPAIKQGAIDPAKLEADAAMEFLLANPLLIRRPLMEVDGTRMVGFDTATVDFWIGLGSFRNESGLDGCAHGPTPTVCHDHYVPDK